MRDNDLISRSALMEYINKTHPYAGLPMAAHICTMELLTYAPAVDAVEAKHGKWETEATLDTFGLPAFRHFHNDETCKYSYVDNAYGGHYYCPFCGTKMDTEIEEQTVVRCGECWKRGKLVCPMNGIDKVSAYDYCSHGEKNFNEN